MRTLLRIIESTLPVELASTLEAHAAACRIDGWTVCDVYVPRRDPKFPRAVVDIAERHIWPAIAQDQDLHVFVIGNVDAPRSGFSGNPDGHPDTSGAYPCPGYWASGSQAGWTDTLDNSGFPSKPQLKNVPGDCVWDQDFLPAHAKCAIGILDLTASTKNKAWKFTGPQSTWVFQAYKRYFDNLQKWKSGEWSTVGSFAHANGLTPTGDRRWIMQTDADQPIFRSPTQPQPFQGHYGFLYDLKGFPPNGSFWFDRRTPVAKVYGQFESYQTETTSSRNQNPLLTGSACSVPVGFELSMVGWETKTVGQLWQQTAMQGRRSWITLYGDPTTTVRP